VAGTTASQLTFQDTIIGRWSPWRRRRAGPDGGQLCSVLLAIKVASEPDLDRGRVRRLGRRVPV